MDVVHIQGLLYYQRHSLCCLELHERFDWRASALGTHRLFFDKILCAFKANPYIHRYLVHNYLHVWQQNSRTLLMDTTQQTTALLLTMQCLTFIRTKLTSYTTHRRVFPIINRYTCRQLLILRCIYNSTTLYNFSEYACDGTSPQVCSWQVCRTSLQICCQAAKQKNIN